MSADQPSSAAKSLGGVVPTEGAFVSVADAARFLGVPRGTVYDLIGRGEFPVRTLRLGSRVLVHRGELEALAS